MVLIVLCLGVCNFVLFAPYVRFHIFSIVLVTEWPPIGEIAAYSAYVVFSWYKYLVINLVFFPPRVSEW